MAQKGINFKITAVNKTKQAFGQIGRGLKGITKAVFSFKTALTGAVGIAGLGLLVRNSLIATDRLGKMSNVLGIAVKDLQTLKLASNIGGVEFETFAKGVKRLTDNFGDFLNGTGEATATFQALGISVTEANKLSGDQMAILGLIADKLSLVENKTLKLKYATEIFGGRASDLINVLDGGSEALQGFALESERFGSLNQQQVKAVENFNDSVTRLKTVFTNLTNLVVANLSPAFQKFSDFLREKLLDAFDEAGGGAQAFAQRMAFGVIDSIEVAIAGMTDFANGVIQTFNNLIEAYNRLPFIDDFPFIEFKFNTDSFQSTLNTLRGIIGDIGTDTSSVFDTVGKDAKKTENEIGKLEKTFSRLKRAGDNFGSTIAGNFEKAVFEAKSFRETLANIGQDIIKIAYQVAITKPLGDALGGAISKGIGGISDMIFKRATGGAVAQGQSYLVGERGAEIFTPNKSGYITPNNKLGGQDSIKVVQEINIMPSVSDVAKAEIFGMLPLIKQEALNGVIDARNRGGSVARSLGVRA